MTGNRGNQLRHVVGDFEIEAGCARGITNRGARGQSSKRDNLRDFVFAVFVRHILHHFVAALVGKVDVDIGRGNAFRIQKALEQQSVWQRIQVGNSQNIRDQTTRRTAATTDQNPAIFAPVDEVLHHQKVARITFVDDNLLLVLHSSTRFVAARMPDRITLVETLFAQEAEETF